MSQEASKKLYVGSLPYSVTEEDLRNLFVPYGSIRSVRIITDKQTGQSKGFGFVEMESEEEAQRAIEGVNGKQLGARTLIVNEARPEQRKERSFDNFSRPKRDFGGGGGRNKPYHFSSKEDRG